MALACISGRFVFLGIYYLSFLVVFFFFFFIMISQLVSCFAKEKIGFLSDCQHDTLFKGFFFFTFLCRFACLFFLTFLSRLACLYAESFGKFDD